MATLATNVSFQCLGLDGKPLAGGKVYTYEAGTTTPKNTYTTHEGDVPNTNPVILDQNGKAKIFLGDGAYRIRIEDKDGALVDDINQISRYVTQSDFAEFQQTVETGINELEQVKDQIDTYVDSSISDQKGYAGGIAPLNESNKVDPLYLPDLPNDAIPQATEIVVGVAKLVNALNSTDDKAALSAAKGKELNDKMFGVGQAWQNVTDNRVPGTTYTNTTGKTIFIYVANRVTSTETNAAMKINISNKQLSFNGGGAGSSGAYKTASAFLPILPEATYSVDAFFDFWELR